MSPSPIEKAPKVSYQQYWIPTLLSYSLVTLLHSIVEVQLAALANELRRSRSLRLKVKELAGDGIERVRCYLTKVAGVDVSDDPAWPELRDLARLRNVIVHRRGLLGPDAFERKLLVDLVKKYRPAIELSEPFDDTYSFTGETAEIRVSLEYCAASIEKAQAFFQRLFEKCELETEARLE